MREMSMLLAESNARASIASAAHAHSDAAPATSNHVSQQLWHADIPTRVRAATDVLSDADNELPLLADESSRDVSLTSHAPPAQASQPSAASLLPSPRPMVTISQCLLSPRASALAGARAVLGGAVSDAATRAAAAHAAAR